jgi:diguanylate cyclase (GGDEF)-like protein
MIETAASVLAGAAAGWLGAVMLGRRRGALEKQKGAAPAGPHLLPDPALGWLMRATGALGVWISELDPGEDGPRAERFVDVDRLSVAQISAVDRRLERARDLEQGGAERMDAGTLVFRASGGFAVGLLLPTGHSPAALQEVERDLDRLLDGVRQRPHVVALAQARSQETAVESVGITGMLLAYQLERITGSEVVVAVTEPSGVRIVGVSGRGDRRLLELVLPATSELARVATGAAEQALTDGDAVGGAVADRRQRQGRTLLLPIDSRIERVGAVALHLLSGVEPTGPARTEIFEALMAAGPRIYSALDREQSRRDSMVDPLTSLPNRRGLDAALRRQGVSRGALIYADLDQFKRLNDTLGHPAGDAALVHFARILRDQVRASDTPARIGGEEFAIWLPDASLELGMRIAERIRIKLGTTQWDWQGRPWPLSASFGVAACPETNPRVENLAAQADAALYVAKRSGRNRVEAAGVGS